MLFNLLLAKITILLCFFFLFYVLSDSLFTNSVKIENARVTFALNIPTGAPTIVANDAIELLPLVTDKTIND